MLAFTFVTVCGAYSFVTPQGTQVHVYETRVNLKRFEKDLDKALELYIQVAPDARKYISTTTLLFFPGQIYCLDNEKPKYGGCWTFSHNVGEVHLNHQCLADTFVSHELTHGLEYHRTWRRKNDHKDPIYWGRNGVMERVDALIRKHTCNLRGR